MESETTAKEGCDLRPLILIGAPFLSPLSSKWRPQEEEVEAVLAAALEDVAEEEMVEVEAEVAAEEDSGHVAA